MTAALILFIVLFLLNCLSFWLYGADKRKAVHGLRRIPESTLLLVAGLGGAYGALMGMLLFRHKTRHTLFLILVPLFFIAWLIGPYIIIDA